MSVAKKIVLSVGFLVVMFAAAKAKKITPKDDKELAETIEDLRFSLANMGKLHLY